jgi:hypothetical protein
MIAMTVSSHPVSLPTKPVAGNPIARIPIAIPKKRARIVSNGSASGSALRGYFAQIQANDRIGPPTHLQDQQVPVTSPELAESKTGKALLSRVLTGRHDPLAGPA